MVQEVHVMVQEVHVILKCQSPPFDGNKNNIKGRKLLINKTGRSENGGINEGCRALSKYSPATKKRRKSRCDEKISAFVDFSARALEHLM